MCEEKKEEESDMSATMNIEKTMYDIGIIRKIMPGSKNDA